jgi:hypothetical protein
MFNIETKVEVLQTAFANGIFPAVPVVNDVHSLAKFGASNHNCKKRRTWTFDAGEMDCYRVSPLVNNAN